MTDYFMEDEEFDEDDEQDEIVQPSPRQIIKREATGSKAGPPISLAFVIDYQGSAPRYPLTVAKWSESAFALLKNLSEGLRAQSPRVDIPITALRGRIELADQKNVRLERYVGRIFGTILWTEMEPQSCRESLNATVLSWLINNVASLATTPTTTQVVEQLKQLARDKRAVETLRRVAAPYDWSETPSRTAKAMSSTSYTDLADFVARQLEGKAVFPDLGGLRRIVGSQLDQNQAELMTEPIRVSAEGHFSLVVRIRILSYPGRTLPIIAVEFSRRIWMHKLREKANVRTIRAYAFPAGSSRVIQWTLRRKKQKDNTWRYQPDDDFIPIARQYFVDEPLTTEAILQNGAQLDTCKLLVVHKNGVGERTVVQAGVPDRDKIDGFDGVTAALAPLGLKPWQGLRMIQSATRPPRDRNQHWDKRNSTKANEVDEYTSWLADAQESIRVCYQGAHHVLIAVQPGHQTEADALFAEQRLQDILQGSVIITRAPIPTTVHGPRAMLPGSDIKSSAERAAQRIAAWQPFIDIVRQYEQANGRKVDGILVIANKWYPGQQHDDHVNKRAARNALASGLGAPVQYLLPREEMNEEGREHDRYGKVRDSHRRAARIDQKFEDRLMIAWLDLAYKSLGRVRPQKLLDQANRLYTPATYPDRILAIGVVRRNTSRFLANERSFLPYAVELDVETGICTASFAYEHPTTKALIMTEAVPLPQALVTLAGLGPIQLATTDNKDEHRRLLCERTQAFFNARLADFGERSVHPLAFIDADSTRSVWPWLKDEEIDPNNIHLAGGFHMEAAWPHIRLVRIRSDNSPKVLWDNEFWGVTEDTKEEIRYRAPGWYEAELFKIEDTIKTNVYLSFGAAIRKKTKGTSCYREISGMKGRGKPRKYAATIFPLHHDVWATPRGLEIFVVRPAGDQPDQVAQLVEWLRQCYAHFGEWTNKPAPLFFDTVLKQYLADYELEDDDDNEEESETEADES